MNKRLMPNPTATNPTVDAYVKAVKRGLKSYHVTSTKSGWAVKRAGASRASSTFSTQKEAVQHAQKVARNTKTEVFIHSKDGRIRERNSYGNDPHPPRG